jgi:adenosylcobinamide-GDP ribazoletransferase
LAAVQFLTRLPTPKDLGVNATVLARSVTWFPAVGLILTGLAALTLAGLDALQLPPLLRATLLVVVLTLATGAFHEDGLADTADGLGGGMTVARKLEIMRDSRIGTYGAVALVLLYLVRVIAIGSLPAHSWIPCLGSALIWGRWTTLPLLAFLPYARTESTTGIAKPLVASVTPGRAVSATVLALASSYFLNGSFLLAPIVIACIVGCATGMKYKRSVGGITGDLLGATNVLTEVAILIYANSQIEIL